MRRLKRLGVALLLAVSTSAMADLEVRDAKLRVLPGSVPAAGYFNLTNTGDLPVVLDGAQSPGFAQVMIHRSAIENGVARMRHVAQLELPAGSTLSFAPGGYHLMLMQRQGPLAPGDQVEVILQFADGQRLPVSFAVVPPGW
ncbi:MAG: copper chaperone PCu(A)C [Azoarcus sp.]|nr:copper chaperone PCu(A)C [Azoarcus sp.]